ncbi:hypothetical protein HU754_014540 [Pseudomonas zeae]|uniref:Uncharacterized protein n=1 Tax=Pseudomonas zeae TaxID=2745510 RepID=A0A9E6NVU7_9PSED|nr:hypothetical protein HU754_014540 [Pseudomonas zeae]
MVPTHMTFQDSQGNGCPSRRQWI